MSARGLGANILNKIIMSAMLQCYEQNFPNKVIIWSLFGQTNSTTKTGKRYIAKARLNGRSTS